MNNKSFPAVPTRAALRNVVAAAALACASHAAMAFDINYLDPDCSSTSTWAYVKVNGTYVYMKAYGELVGEMGYDWMYNQTWYGDSRTVTACNLRVTNPDGSTAVVKSTLNVTLPKAVSGSGYRQRAVSGTSLRQLIAGTDGLNAPWAQQMVQDTAKTIVIAHGVNDAWQDVDQKRTNGPAEFAANLRFAVNEALKLNGRKVLLVQPHRTCDFAMLTWLAPSLPHPDALVAPYADAVAKVGNEFKADSRYKDRVEVAHLFSLPTRCDGDYRKSDMPDGLHGSQAYSNKAAAVVKEALNRLLNGGPAPLPTLTFMRAPLDPNNKFQPVPGKDFETVLVGLPHVTNWSTTNATAVSYNCTSADPNGFNGGSTLTQLVQAGYWSIVPNWPVPASCTWTVTGPGGTVTYPDTYTTARKPVSSDPMIAVTRSPMPLIAGQPFHTTWKAERATSLTRVCTASGSGFNAPSTSMALKSATGTDPYVDEPVTETANAAWIGHPTTCTWTARNSSGQTTTYTETFHTVAR